jgi:Trk-type K+ transport system membrane component
MRVVLVVYVVYVVIFVVAMHLYGNPETAYVSASAALSEFFSSDSTFGLKSMSEAPAVTYY